MLPYLKPKPAGAIIIAHATPEGRLEGEHKEGEELVELEVAAEEVLKAIAAKDARALAKGLRAAFYICDAFPHEEGPHEQDKD